MTLRSDLIPVVDDVRSIPEEFGLRVRTVTIRVVTRSATGAASLTAAQTTTTLELEPAPRVRDATQRRDMPAGSVEEGDLVVDKISATYTRSQLDPSGDAAWLIDGAPHRLVSLEQKSFGWRAVVRRQRRT